ncbi:UDP-galactopyranose mutase [hydrothermal vent metagenome]|uniref:UDP-galactopyranose mutase n=1 Tax=hydrothermal vent metagenome TaxID=652676 RepID=A0A3B0YX73_9ZZZZ
MARSVAIAGAGFSGAVIANRLASEGFKVHVFEPRDHIGGNCYTQRDPETQIMIHKYGPHIFHTDNREVWEFVNRFADFHPYTNRVKAVSGGRVYSLPINLHTINQFYGKCLDPKDAYRLIEEESDQSITAPVTFEDQALRYIGRKLYEAFFYGYTKKQWGCEPSELPASILKRLPVRFDYNDNYFSHDYQGIPVDGYTPIFEALLDHSNISVFLGQSLPGNHAKEYCHTFYSGPLDAYFDYRFGELGYRSLRFDESRCEGDYQGCAVMNYCDAQVPYTRITEHKHFAPWESHGDTVVYHEYSFTCGRGDIPFYPVRLVGDKLLLEKYVGLGKGMQRVTFVGRLGTYRYLDMDKTIEEALFVADKFLHCSRGAASMPAFPVSPYG